MQKQSGFVQILVVVLLLVGIASLGLYYMSTRSNNPILSSPPSSTSSPTLPTSNPTEGWQVIENQYYKFKMHFPNNWTKFNVSGLNSVSGTATISSPNAESGVINIYWGGGFGGGPCPEKKTLILTKSGNLWFCQTKYSDGSENWSISNNDPLPQNYPPVKITASLKSLNDESLIKEIISTFEFLK